MKLQNIEYNSNYFTQIMELLKKTWDFSLHFKNLKDENYLYGIYLKKVLINCSYKKVIVDESGKVQGSIFAQINNYSNRLKMFRLNTSIFFHVLKGSFGKRAVAFKFFHQYIRECNKLYEKPKFDREVYLLMVSSNTKGKGIGKLLIDDYVNECKKNSIKKIGLQTGADCDYRFYDHLGFTRENAIYTDMYIKGNEKENFFIYTKII